MKLVLFIIIIAAIVFFGVIYYQNSQVPVLGVSEGRLKPLSDKPNNISTQATDDSKRVPTLAFKNDDLALSMQAVLKATNLYGSSSIKQQTEDYLYLVFTTPTMHYHDDVEFWFDRDKRVIHFRSSSRAGYSDMGMNKKRYEALSVLYNEQ